MNATIETENQDTLLTAQQLAERFQLLPITIYRAAWRGELPSVKIGRSRRFRPAAVESYLNRSQQPQAKKKVPAC